MTCVSSIEAAAASSSVSVSCASSGSSVNVAGSSGSACGDPSRRAPDRAPGRASRTGSTSVTLGMTCVSSISGAAAFSWPAVSCESASSSSPPRCGATGAGLATARQRGSRTPLAGAWRRRPASVTAGMTWVWSMSGDSGSSIRGRGYPAVAPAFTACSWRIVDSTRRTARARASSMTRASSACRARSAKPARLMIFSSSLALSGDPLQVGLEILCERGGFGGDRRQLGGPKPTDHPRGAIDGRAEGRNRQ